MSERAPLVAGLRERIRRSGHMTFRDFMAAVLYDERHGYYPTHPSATSRSGDYVTSPEVHPIFAAMVGRQLLEMWQALDRPSKWTIVEQGAGRGVLARDVLLWAQAHHADFLDALRYVIVEPITTLQLEQERTLSSTATKSVNWSADAPAALEGCVIANELLDAFPVHRVMRRGDELQEVYVSLDGDRFVDHLGPPSTPDLRTYFEALGLLPGDGCIAEVNLEAPRWITDVASRIARGYVLLFDYGYEAPALYAPWRRDGTLLCFYRQAASGNPYQRIGMQDMTASIDFTTVRRAGEASGAQTIGYTDQASFLTRLGITDGMAPDGSTEMEEYFARRNIVLELIDPAGLGRVRVLAMGKGTPATALRGFRDE